MPAGPANKPSIDLSRAAASAGPKRSRNAIRLPLPQGHDDVALVDVRDIKALVRVGDSWIHNAVATGNFPAPVIRSPRFTRWRLSDVKEYLRALAQVAL